MSLLEEVGGFLRATFPGSTLMDGYFFVRVTSAAQRRVASGGLQPILDRLDGRLWMVAVGLDPAGLPQAKQVEETGVLYNPDWNINEPMTLHLAELAAPPSLEAMWPHFGDVHALAFFAPERKLALNVAMLSLHGPAGADFSAFDQWLAKD
jgi:hypothetical protein